jgi:hypothetical protein
MDYRKIRSLKLHASCTGLSKFEWDELMKGRKRANKKEINRLVKEHLPDLYNDLALDYANPYNYFRTDMHLILVHSAIEYFIAYI